MPFTEPDGYERGHFSRVFRDVFRPACESAGYTAVRADDVRATNLIHLDVLQRLLESPMVLCDLSSRNPNVLFELGLRQAFDKPVVLVQEVGAPAIFDVALLRCTEYRKALRYDEVLEDQRSIAQAIRETADAFQKGAGTHSIVRILSLLRPAALLDVKELIREELSSLLRSELRGTIQTSEPARDEAVLPDLARVRSLLGDFDQDLAAMQAGGELDTTFHTRLAILRGYLRIFIENRDHFSQRQREIIDSLDRDLKDLERRSASLGASARRPTEQP